MEYFSEIPFVVIELGNLTMNPLNRVIRYYYKYETTTNNIILNSAAFKFKEPTILSPLFKYFTIRYEGIYKTLKHCLTKKHKQAHYFFFRVRMLKKQFNFFILTIYNFPFTLSIYRLYLHHITGNKLGIYLIFMLYYFSVF